MNNTNRSAEKGVSLLFAMITLMLLSAIAMGMMFMSSTETSINSNFKAEETAYFAARAGLEEVRDRMLPANANTLTAVLPASLPTAGNGVVYVVQPGVTAANITTFGSNNALVDDELCHDWGAASFGGMTPQPANVRCTDLPSGTAWFQTVPSVAPFAGSANPIDYKWVRLTLKQNDSTPYGAPYGMVDSTQAAGNQVCWNGISEVVVPSNATPCSALSPTANPVYMATALAVTVRGARRLIQQEIAQTPTGGFPYGLFATGRGCGALSMGGGAQTFSFNAATQNPPTNPPSNISASGGNVGTNGNMNLSGTNTTVHGTSSSAIGGIGNCNQGNGITVSGGAAYGTASTVPIQNLPVPPLPNPLPPTRSCPTYCYNSSQTLTPGAYGNVNITSGATITLAGGTPNSPAVFTLNSISLGGGSTLVINGTVVLNIAGIGQQNPVNFTGGSFQNNTFVPNNFVINYGGSNNISLTGGSAAYAVVNAPNANISFSGGSNFYGQAIGATISNTGGTNFYYDQSLNTPGPNNNSYYEISMRELSY
jgi:hypothetical protein